MSETYYDGFYGFVSPPFHITPDPALLFPTETHHAALGAIEYGISAGKGFVVVTGEVGVGKTTVLRACLDALDTSKTKLIYLFNPALSTPELYAAILDEFITLPPSSNPANTLRVLQRALLATHEIGTQVILTVDEAQNMPEATLESLRVLSNLETNKSKLMQIILVGQPELDTLLAKHSLRQLAQRVAVRARIRPLSFRQSCRYIRHRTRCAGRAAIRPLFTTPALYYLAFFARGIPRTINICCDNALINGYGQAAERISLRIARESCRAMKFRSPLRHVVAFGMAVMLLVGVFTSIDTLLRHYSTVRAARSTMEVSAIPPRPALDGAKVDKELVTPAPPLDPAPAAVAVASTAFQPSPLDNSAAQGPPPEERPGRADTSSQDATGATAHATAASSKDTATLAQDTAETPADRPSALRPDPTSPVPPATIPWIPAEETATKTTASARSPVKWFVRLGDTVYKACRTTYGACDEETLRKLLAYNPQIRSNAEIRPGDLIILPEQVKSATPN